jgi:type I restriction enzyme S subunit
MTEWEETTLGKICEESGGNIQTGPFGSQLHASDYVPVGVPSIMPQNIGDNRVMTDSIARITDADARRLSRYLVKSGDIVYSRRGDVERRALIRETEEGWLCGTGCLRVRFGDKKPISSTFMSYYLDAPNIRMWIVQHAHGATMPNLNTAILSDVPVRLPPYQEQKAIADVLSALDDKIELNRQMNQTLEATAQALFKSWFVDFDPVQAKAEGRKPEGMNDVTATLFPSAFTESKLGPIPEGWAISEIGKEVEVVGGSTPSTQDMAYWEDGEFYWATPNVKAGALASRLRTGRPDTTNSKEQRFRTSACPTPTNLRQDQLTPTPTCPTPVASAPVVLIASSGEAVSPIRSPCRSFMR